MVRNQTHQQEDQSLSSLGVQNLVWDDQILLGLEVPKSETQVTKIPP